MIFPSLHGTSQPRIKTKTEQPAALTSSSSSPNRATNVDAFHSIVSPTDVGSSIMAVLPKPSPAFSLPILSAPPLTHSDSVVDISSSHEEFVPMVPVVSLSTVIAPKKEFPPALPTCEREIRRRAPLPPSSSTPRTNIVGTSGNQQSPLRHHTYYPPASVPTTISSGEKTPLPTLKPLPSILRKSNSLLGSSPPRGSSSVSSLGEGDGAACAPQSQLATQITPPLSSDVPTLASPASIKTLQCNRPLPEEGGSEQDNEVGESLHFVKNLPDAKVFPKKQRQCIRRNQSDTVVKQHEEDESKCRRASIASSSGHDNNGVSRHVSLEDLPSNKRIGFDPHITVYEFSVTQYEMKGGEKWYTEDQMVEFKKEAINRIRLRQRESVKVIPTGTGRALAVPPTGMAPFDANKSGGEPKGFSFNHPALGCEDDFDMQCRVTMSSPVNSPSSMGAAAAHIKNILVVDTHDVCLSLFRKALKVRLKTERKGSISFNFWAHL